MFLTPNISVNGDGRLTLNGMDSVKLAQEYGTPLYLMDENLIRENMRLYKSSMDRFYDGNGLICYASKAFACKHIYRVASEEKIGADVASAGELHTALSAGMNPKNICYHGNYKPHDELVYAVENNVGRVVCDSLSEVFELNEISSQRHKTSKILLRICPGIEAHTHDFIKTGGIDSKYGFPIQTGAAMEAAKLALSLKNIDLSGVHCHIGSQIFDIEPFAHTAEIMFEFMMQVKRETGETLAELNLGGGFGIKYNEKDDPAPYDKYMETVSGVLKNAAAKHGVKLPFIIMEPGRSIVGAAGVTLYTVGPIKEIPNVRRYVSIDGGMTDNIRYALYDAEYDFEIANKADKPKTMTAAIAGRCCESGDLLAKETKIQECEQGDILAVLATGAYNYSMSSNYNRVPKPAVVMLYNGKASVAVKRETLDDLMRNDV